MTLAGMAAVDNEALICDMAETYGIFDYRSLPARTAAMLSAGLRENSRIKLKMSGTKAPVDTLLMVAVFDRINHLIWMRTEDGHKGINHPVPLMKSFVDQDDPDDHESFETGNDFDQAREALLKNARRKMENE